MKKKQKMPLEAVVAITIGIIFSTLFAVTAIGDDQGEMGKPSDIKADAVTVAPSATESYPVEEPTINFADTEEVSIYLSLSKEKRAMVERCAAAADVDVNMVRAICFQESRFQPTLTHTNSNGTVDWGVGQCNDSTFETLHARIGINNMQELLDFETGIRACCALLQYYKTDLGIGNPNDLLLAYQQGYTGLQNVKNGSAEPWAAYEKTLGSMAIYAGYFSA